MALPIRVPTIEVLDSLLVPSCSRISLAPIFPVVEWKFQREKVLWMAVLVARLQ